MTIEFDDTMEWGEILKQARKQLNGNAPGGMRYTGERKNGKIIITAEAI